MRIKPLDQIDYVAKFRLTYNKNPNQKELEQYINWYKYYKVKGELKKHESKTKEMPYNAPRR